MGLDGPVIECLRPGITFVSHDTLEIRHASVLWRRIQHLLVVELLQEVMEPAGAELIAGEFQPFLGHGKEGGARILITRMLCQFEAFGRRPPELTVLIALHAPITTFVRNLFPRLRRKMKNEISPPAAGPRPRAISRRPDTGVRDTVQ
jgi:hypothetical protein